MKEEFSTTRKYVTLAIAVLVELTVSLVVTGWPAFEPVLIDNGVFFNLCNASAVSNATHSTCPEQVFQLGSYPFSPSLNFRCHEHCFIWIAKFSFSISRIYQQLFWVCLPFRYGGFTIRPRYLTLAGAGLGFMGYLLLSFSSPSFNAYIVAWGLLGKPFIDHHTYSQP